MVKTCQYPALGTGPYWPKRDHSPRQKGPLGQSTQLWRDLRLVNAIQREPECEWEMTYGPQRR